MEEVNRDLLFSVEIQNKLPIFLKKWWLDVVAPGKWHYLALKKNDLIVVWPVLTDKRYFFKISKMPPFTQYLGPYIVKDDKRVVSVSEEIKLYNTLLGEISHYNIFKQRLNLQVKNLLPFIWEGFRTSVRYTYRIYTKQMDLNDIIENMSDTRVRKIKKGEELFSVENSSVSKNFTELVKKVFIRKSEKIPSSIDKLEEIYRESIRHNSGILLNAKKQGNGNVCGAALFVKDKYTLYYLIGTYNEEIDDKGIISSLLIWKGIKIAKNENLVFDFEGSILKGVEYFFRTFGGKLTPYYEVSKVKPGIFNIIYRGF